MPRDLKGLRILVVEDEFLVAMDIELMLRDLGCEVVGPIGDLTTALRTARDGAFDLALLDVNIGGQRVTAVADVLVERAVPMIFCTGYQAGNLPDRYSGAPTLMKPLQPTDVEAALQRVAADAAGDATG